MLPDGTLLSVDNGRTILALIVTTLLIWRLFVLVAQPVRNSLSQSYLALAEEKIGEGDWSAVKEAAERAETLTGVTDDLTVLRSNLYRMESSIFAERDWLQTHKQGDRLAKLESVLIDYPTPKEMLVQVQVLADQGEKRYASLLLARAEQQSSDYTGLQTMKEYLNYESNN